MAFRASDIAVCADEREPGLAVIERLDLAPRCFRVAAFARSTKAALVRIVGLVAVEAASRGLAVFGGLGVATVAAGPLVRPRQDEVRERMIERLTIELNDVDLSPLVIGMTGAAFGFGCLRMAAVETPSRLAVRRNRLVASEAKLALGLAREGFVTAAADLFQLRMSADERARHDQLLEYPLGVRQHRCGHQKDLRAQQNQEVPSPHRASPLNRGGRQSRGRWRQGSRV